RPRDPLTLTRAHHLHRPPRRTPTRNRPAPRRLGRRRNRRSAPTSGGTTARTTPNRRRRATGVIHSRPLSRGELDT
ncbi:hypothetical protein HMPREF9005_1969, partial [Actinomyces sp. oral taxon 178 str. F0338]